MGRILNIRNHCVAIGIKTALMVFLGAAEHAMAQTSEVNLPKIPKATNMRVVDISVPRPLEPKATYKIIAIGKGPEGSVVSVNTRYSDITGWVYTARATKCSTGKMKTLGSGETMEQMIASGADSSWGSLVDGSSATQVAEIACRESGRVLKGVR